MFLAQVVEVVEPNSVVCVSWSSLAAIAGIVSSIPRATSHSVVCHDVLIGSIRAAVDVVVIFLIVSHVNSTSAIAASEFIFYTSAAGLRAPVFVAAFFMGSVVASMDCIKSSTHTLASLLSIFAAVALVSAFLMLEAVNFMFCS